MAKRRLISSANRPPPTGNPNRLLAALPAADYARIIPSLVVVPRPRSLLYSTRPPKPSANVSGGTSVSRPTHPGCAFGAGPSTDIATTTARLTAR